MAARFSVDEVIDHVALDDVSDAEPECIPPSIEEVIKLSVDQFNPLRGSIDNMFQFRRDASSCLENIYKKHEHGKSDEMERSLLSVISVGSIIPGEVMSWLKSLHRRMLPTPKSRNPWCIEFTRDMPKDIFIHFREAIRRGRSRFGVTVGESTIKFTHKNRLIRDFAKMTGLTHQELKQKLQKIYKGNRLGCRAEILLSEEKPFLIAYHERHMRVSLELHYGFWNQFGYGHHS